ncbi:dihydroneopterin aldolase [Abditibacterium utsteinense]|uniref:7,8-dihydroneopterin aldolase n=1 Tax=Abditibacterium utsteinense TaxID=1960156 RepID=A0A2S8SXI5_9BACT|nr:dihydroneopterin aldolase [Abditibacterium utsteinense]PQV65504.1 dihydroneopterin aldolase [Abditibacterium utsteinense]
MDKILLSGLQFFGKHGCHPAENDLGQMFVVDIEIDADLQRAADSDDLNQTVNYVEIYQFAKQTIEGPSAALLEHLAGKIGDFALQSELVSAARVKIKKPHVAVGGVLDFLGVEIERKR